MLELVPEGRFRMAVAAARQEEGDLVWGEADRIERANVRLDLLAEERALPGPSLHGQGEGRECPSSSVDLKPIEVVGEDQAGDV